MKKSKINFEIELDKDSVPEKIEWNATDASEELKETKSISISLWDHMEKNSMRIDLWTKDMPVDEMKRFYIDCLGGMAQSVLNATGDEFMSQEMNDLCDKLVAHVEREMREQK
jgi:gliding motility-associated protein GldC